MQETILRPATMIDTEDRIGTRYQKCECVPPIIGDGSTRYDIHAAWVTLQNLVLVLNNETISKTWV
jgi:hypothetical protein